MMRHLALLFLGSILTGCASVTISPRSIAAIKNRGEEGQRLLSNWNQAVAIANEFLASDFNATLPRGRLVLSDDGMAFVADGEPAPLVVRCNISGDLMVPFTMVAQERSRGFVVGLVRPKRDRAMDNSLFKDRWGRMRPDFHVAETILHELCHVHHRVGTVSPWKSVAYYAESIFLVRYRTHSMERLPFKTSAEFKAFVRDHFEQQKRATSAALPQDRKQFTIPGAGSTALEDPPP